MANFKYCEEITTSQNLLATLKKEITEFAFYEANETAGEVEEANEWSVIKEDADASTLILGTKATIGEQTKEFHIKFVNPCHTSAAEHSSLKVQVLVGPKADGTYEHEGPVVNYEWAKEDFTPATDRDKTKPVYYYLNITNNRLAMILVGDPAVNFNDYRKSFLYVGALKPFKYNMDDVDQNIMITAGAVAAELATPLSFGQYTSYGNNTLQMFQTKSGIRFQKHYASFITQAPEPTKAYVDPKLGDTGLLLEPQGFNASAWTRKYHLSPIYVVHPYDGYRGQLDTCIAVSKNNILHLDELIVDVDPNDTSKKWKQEVYRYFDHNTEQNFMNSSANVKMGVAFLKEVRY